MGYPPHYWTASIVRSPRGRNVGIWSNSASILVTTTALVHIHPALRYDRYPATNMTVLTTLIEAKRSDDTKQRLPLCNSHEQVVQAIVDIDSKENSWFYRLVTLTFGLVLVIVAYILYIFPAHPVTKSGRFFRDRREGSELVAEYILLLGPYIFILTTFAALCLVLRNMMPERFRRWIERLSPKRRALLRECAWAFVLIALIALVALVDWFSLSMTGLYY